MKNYNYIKANQSANAFVVWTSKISNFFQQIIFLCDSKSD